MASFTEENDDFLVELVSKNPPLYDSRLKSYKDNIVRDNIWENIASKLNKTSDDCKKRWKCIRDSYYRKKRKNKLPTGSAAGAKFKKWPLLDRLCFLEKVPTERKTLCNIENIEIANDTNSNDSENISNDDVNCFTEESNVETNNIEMNNEVSNGTEMATTPTYATDVIERADDTEPNKKAKGRVLKKKKQNQNSTMQAALLQYWKERDAERRAQIQALSLQSTSNQEQEPDDDGINSFCSHVKTMLRKLNPILKVEAKTKVFNLLADYELRSLNQGASSSNGSPSSSNGNYVFDQNSQCSYYTNTYSPISSVVSPTVQATDLTLGTSNTLNLPSNSCEDVFYTENNNNLYLP